MNNIRTIAKKFGTHNLSVKKDIFSNREDKVIKTKYNYYTQEEEFNKEFLGAHKNHKYTIPFDKFCFKPFELGWFNYSRDNDTGNARYNATAAYPNKLSNILYRSSLLQSKLLMKFAMRFLDSRGTMYNQVSEPHPNITTNSVFLYRDPSNYLNTRRGLERLFVAFILAKGLNFSGVILYSFVICYLGLYQRWVNTSKSMVMRMDLIPEHELVNFVKIGAFGIPYSRTVAINKLEKIPLEVEGLYYYRWFKTITWVPIEDKNLIYRNVDTGESFTFSKRGIWNKDGISHELLSKL